MTTEARTITIMFDTELIDDGKSFKFDGIRINAPDDMDRKFLAFFFQGIADDYKDGSARLVPLS